MRSAIYAADRKTRLTKIHVLGNPSTPKRRPSGVSSTIGYYQTRSLSPYDGEYILDGWRKLANLAANSRQLDDRNGLTHSGDFGKINRVLRLSALWGDLVSVHRIRLLGPWDYVWLGMSDPGMDAPPSLTGQVKMPCDWKSIFGPRSGRAAFSRRFHKPTNLELHERVFIVLTGVGGGGSISLNGLHLSEFDGKSRIAEAEVTHELESFNLLEITVQHAFDDDSLGGLYDAVILEIRQA